MTHAAPSQAAGPDLPPSGPLPTAPVPAAAPVQTTVPVQVQRLDPDAPLPSYALDGDAGADLCTMVDVRLAPGERALLPTGLAIALPAGYAGFVHPRSGLAWRAGLSLVNAPGTVDSGYRGEIKLIVVNHDRDRVVELRRGDRIAQLVIQRVEQARFEVVERLPGSARGTAGHGSTGGAGALRDGVPDTGHWPAEDSRRSIVDNSRPTEDVGRPTEDNRGDDQ